MKTSKGNIFSKTVFQIRFQFVFQIVFFQFFPRAIFFSKGSLYPLVGKSGAPSCREGLRTGPETSPESSAGARAMAVLCGNPPAWVCVRHAPRTARRRLDRVRSNFGLSPLTGSLYPLLFLENVLSSCSRPGAWRQGGWVGVRIRRLIIVSVRWQRDLILILMIC